MTPEAIALLASISFALFAVYGLAWFAQFDAADGDNCLSGGAHPYTRRRGSLQRRYSRLQACGYGCVRFSRPAAERDQPFDFHRTTKNRHLA